MGLVGAVTAMQRGLGSSFSVLQIRSEGVFWLAWAYGIFFALGAVAVIEWILLD